MNLNLSMFPLNLVSNSVYTCCTEIKFYVTFYISIFRMFSYGEFKAEDQEKMLASLNRKVEQVYRSCIGDNEANIR